MTGKTPRIGEIRENLRRIRQAKMALNLASQQFDLAFSGWTNRKVASDATSAAMAEATLRLNDLRREIAGDEAVWAAHERAAAIRMDAKRAATIAAKGGKA